MITAGSTIDNHRFYVAVRHLMPVLCIAMLLVETGCGPKRQEEWNSYYYGTERVGTGVYYPTDNDSNYVRPKGMWEDEQIPQGQKWR